MDDMLPKGLTYAALGLSVLGLCAVLVWGVVRVVLARMTSQSATSNELDARSTLLIKEATGAWQQLADMQKGIIDEERKEKLRAQDEREAITKQFIDYATVQTAAHSDEMGKMREQFLESQKRLHDRLDRSDSHQKECHDKLSQAEAKIRDIEMKQYNTALLTPVAVAPAAPVASAAQAATTFSMPATGFTITPGVPG